MDKLWSFPRTETIESIGKWERDWNYKNQVCISWTTKQNGKPKPKPKPHLPFFFFLPTQTKDTKRMEWNSPSGGYIVLVFKWVLDIRFPRAWNYMIHTTDWREITFFGVQWTTLIDASSMHELYRNGRKFCYNNGNALPTITFLHVFLILFCFQ